MSRRLTTHPTQVAAIGLAATVVVAALTSLGVFNRLERVTIDYRFQHARMRSTPMSDRIRHVDIDDGALNSVGRWPWSRVKIALALDELRKAGASVVALDLLLDDPQEPTFEPIETEDEPKVYLEVDHDRAMAEALSKLQSVLFLNVQRNSSIGPDWSGLRGEREYARLMELLRTDVEISDEEAIEQAALTEPRRTLFQERAGLFRDLAASQVAAEMLAAPGPKPTLEQFVRRMTPQLDENTGLFPQLAMLQRVWGQQRSWWTLRPKLRGLTTDARWTGAEDRAPLLQFAEVAAEVGIVNAEPEAEADRAIRDVLVARPTPGGEALQFGLAAAAALQGIHARDVVIEDDRIVIGEHTLPVRDGRLLLDWPNTKDGYLGALRQSAQDPIGYGHMSMGRLISLSEQRPVLAGLEEQLLRVAFEIATGSLGRDLVDESAIDEALMEEISQLADLTLQQVDAASGDQPLSDEERDQIAPFREYSLVREAVRNGRAELQRTEDEVRDFAEGRLVFIGWIATGAAADFFNTAMGPKTPGVVIHAVAADMALTGRAARPAPRGSPLALSLLMGAVATFVAATLSPVRSFIAGTGVAIAYALGCGYLLFNPSPLGPGVLLPIAGPLIAALVAWVSGTSLEAALYQRDRERIRKQFRARVSPQLVERLVDNPASVSMTGEQREMTTIFIDLAGFTSISEMLDGPTTVATLNRAMRENTRVLTAEGAYVNKFLGDGIMAFWSAFAADPEQASRACRAALECQRTVLALNDDPVMNGLPRLSARVGVATGTVVVGDCGAPPELNDYTVIGNAVNLAARLESANKQFGTGVMIDGRTRELAGDSPNYLLRNLGRIIVVGQTTPVEIFEVLPPNASKRRIDLTHEGVALFQAGDFLGALTVFTTLANEFGDVKLAAVYRDGVADAADQGEAFDGALRLRAK